MYEYNLALRFQRIAAERPQSIALWFKADETVTYVDLNRSANRLARALAIQFAVEGGDVVCIGGIKSPATFAAMLACLKLGAVYSVLDPDSPTERLRKILHTCAPKLVMGCGQFISHVQELGYQIFNNDEIQNDVDDNNLAQSTNITGSHPAYIMFTSGSTGFPKGALMTHSNVLNLIDWAQQTFAITGDNIMTNVNPMYFDNSVFDFYAALFNGARLVPFSKEETRDPKKLVEKIDTAQCTSWFSVPSLLIFLQTMRALDGTRLRSIRQFIFGGEGYPKAKLKHLFDNYPDAKLYNVYGPTECTCICSSQELGAADFEDLQGLPRLGRIAPNFSFLLIGEDGRAVTQGETGELCLLGPNVGKGYYNDPERTAANFVQNPTHNSYGDVMYKTGDLARVDERGDLHIQGRKDNQIKHMGYRIELEEIEAALSCLSYVSEAAVLHTRVNGFSRIIAVLATPDEIDFERVRSELRHFIPDYMVPTEFHREKSLPKNANGKVDRRHLSDQYSRVETTKGP